MIDKIKGILDDLKFSAYKIVENKINSEEMFFIKKDLDMIRSKEIHNFKVTVYKDFVVEGLEYKGSSTFDIHPTMKEDEIKQLAIDNYFAAGFVKNQYYKIPNEVCENVNFKESTFSKKSLTEWMTLLVDALYKEDKFDNGGINSSEVFLNKTYKRIINSEGIDISYESYNGMIEFITYWTAEEEIELYKVITFSEYNPEYIEQVVKEMLFLSQKRAEAKETPNTGRYKVIFRNDSVRELLNYYTFNTSVEGVYNKVSSLILQDNVQGDEVEGDLISFDLDPYMSNSVKSMPYDNDGIILKKVRILDKGVFNKYHGDARHSFYLNVDATGIIENVIFEGGSKTLDEMKSSPYLELLSFSDFQLDSLTGDFGGEIRLAILFDGKNTKALTGGSVSGNIKSVQNNMYLSKDLQFAEGFIGPKAIEMFEIEIAGK